MRIWCFSLKTVAGSPHFCKTMIHKPISAPDQSFDLLLEQYEKDLYTVPLRAKEMVHALETVDFSALNQVQRVRYCTLMGFAQNELEDYRLAEKNYLTAIELASVHDEPYSQSYLLALLAGVQMNKQQLAEAAANLDLAVSLLPDNAPATDLAFIQCKRGFLMLRNACFEQATDYFLTALETLPPDPQPSVLSAHIQATVYSGLGEVFEHIGDREKSRESYLKCLSICKEAGIQFRLAWYYHNAGICMLNAGELSQAKDYFQKTLSHADSRMVTAHAYANLGKVYIKEHQFPLAIEYFDKAEQVYGPPVTAEDYSNLSVLEYRRAEVAQNLNQEAEVQRHLEKAFTLGARGRNRQHLVEVCRSLGSFHSMRNEYRQAYEYSQHAEQFNAEYSEQKQEAKVRELQIKHEAAQKEKEAALAKAELAAAQLGSLRAQFNPHFIFNALNGLANMISSNRNDEASELLFEFSKLLRMSLDLSNDEWIPLDKELEFALLYVQMQKKLKYRGNLFTIINIPKEVSAHNYRIPSMVLQPFIENAIEHGLPIKGGGNIRINFEQSQPGILRCTIEDDGIGLKAAQKLQEKNYDKHKSRGMKFTHDRLKMLLDAQSSGLEPIELIDLSEIGAGAGTRVTLQIPVK